MPKHQFVAQLPDLIHPVDYAADPEGRRMRFRIKLTADGVELIGDAMRSVSLESLLESLDPEEIEQMLCG